MARYKFYQDVERIAREREFYYVDAESFEEARERVKSMYDLGSPNYDNLVRWDETETLEEEFTILSVHPVI